MAAPCKDEGTFERRFDHKTTNRLAIAVNDEILCAGKPDSKRTSAYPLPFQGKRIELVLLPGRRSQVELALG
jgi:hypothetical protein